MSDKAFKVTAGAIGALAMAVVVRSLVTPSTVEVQTGARVVCSQCGKTISESITTVEVRESEAASRKVTETKAVCEQCATRSAQAAAQRARQVPQLAGPPRQPPTPAREGAEQVAGKSESTRIGDRLPAIRYREDIEAEAIGRARAERTRQAQQSQQRTHGNPRPADHELATWINRALGTGQVQVRNLLNMELSHDLLTRNLVVCGVDDVANSDSLDYPLSVTARVRWVVTPTLARQMGLKGSDGYIAQWCFQVNPQTGSVSKWATEPK